MIMMDAVVVKRFFFVYRTNAGLLHLLLVHLFPFLCFVLRVLFFFVCTLGFLSSWSFGQKADVNFPLGERKTGKERQLCRNSPQFSLEKNQCICIWIFLQNFAVVVVALRTER